RTLPRPHAAGFRRHQQRDAVAGRLQDHAAEVSHRDGAAGPLSVGIVPPSLGGKVCVITGATSGIGRVAAERLARMGARLVLVARAPARAQATLARLRAAAPAAAHRVHYADLSRIAEMKRVAAEIAAAEPRIDLLVNNAGALFGA